MFLQALDTIHVSSVRSDNIIAGQTFEFDDLGGRSLIERGLAIEVDGKAHKLAQTPATDQAEAPEPQAALESLEQPLLAVNTGANARKKVP